MDNAGQLSFVLERASAAHAEAIRSIYNDAVTNTTFTFDLVPRTLDDQLRWIDEHSGAHPAVVALDPTGKVAGFASLSPYRPRPAYSTTVEDSVYIEASMRSKGLGKLLVNELIRLAQAYGFHAVIARIVGGHEASIGLHAACGFELIGVERQVGRKFGRWLDVAVMENLLQ